MLVLCLASYRMQKKSLVKHIFNFAFMWQDLAVANKIAEWCHVTGMFEKKCDSDWRSLIARLLKKKYFWVRLKLRQGGKLSYAYTNYIASIKKAIMRASRLSCMLNRNKNWISVSPDSFLCVLDTDYAHILCTFRPCFQQVQHRPRHGWAQRCLSNG